MGPSFPVADPAAGFANWGDGLGAVSARIEAPQAPRGWGV